MFPQYFVFHYRELIVNAVCKAEGTIQENKHKIFNIPWSQMRILIKFFLKFILNYINLWAITVVGQ